MKEYSISDCFPIIRNGASIKQDKISGGIPITRIESISDGTLDLNKLGYAGITDNSFSQFYLQDGDILMSHINSVSHLGKVALVENLEQTIIHGMNLLCLKADREIINPKYAYYYFRTPKFISGIGKVTKKSVNQASFNITSFEKLKIKIHEDLNQQIHIANILTKAESLIQQRKQSITLLDEFLKSTFLEMFGDPVRNEKGWEINSLKNFARIRIGPFGSLLHSEDYIQGGVPLVNPSHIKEGKIEIDCDLTVSKNKMKELDAYIMHEGDVVLARRGEIGRCAVVTQKEDGFLCGTGSIFIRPQKGILPIYIYNVISSNSMKMILENAAKGITMKNLNSGIVEEIQFPVPPIELQNQFAHIVVKTETLKQQNQQNLQQLEQLFGSLSQQAFKGELVKGV